MRLLKCYRLKKYMVCELSRFRTQLAKKESQGPDLPYPEWSDEEERLVI